MKPLHAEDKKKCALFWFRFESSDDTPAFFFDDNERVRFVEWVKLEPGVYIGYVKLWDDYKLVSTYLLRCLTPHATWRRVAGTWTHASRLLNDFAAMSFCPRSVQAVGFEQKQERRSYEPEFHLPGFLLAPNEEFE